MPLGSGYSAEEQITGRAEHGGIQIVAYPMKRDVYQRRFPERRVEKTLIGAELRLGSTDSFLACSGTVAGMGLGAGGRMRQEIFEDPFAFEDWDLSRSSRCFVHIANSMVWSDITGNQPPTTPPTAREYTAAGLPWFDFYDETAQALGGSGILAKVKSVMSLGKEKGDVPLPENQPVDGEKIVALRAGLRPRQVREGRF
jgi:hypothetical protein